MKEGKVLQKLMNPNDVLRSVSERDIFGFGTRESDDRLFLGTPGDGAKADEECEAGD